jgi:hypothetical protein
MDLEALSRLPSWNWSGAARRTILRGLLHPGDDASRLLAAELAGELVVMNDELAGALAVIVRNPREPTELRCRAAISLGPLLEELDLQDPGDPYDAPPCSEEVASEVRRTLSQAYRDTEAPKELRRKALEASVRAPQPWHAAAVHAAFHSEDPSWRVTSVFCMQYVRSFDEELMLALETDDPVIQYEAVRAAGAAGVERAWPRIRWLLLDEETDRPTLLAAIEAASSVNAAPDELEEALANLIDGGDHEVAAAAMDAMMEMEHLEGMGEWHDDEWEEDGRDEDDDW